MILHVFTLHLCYIIYLSHYFSVQSFPYSSWMNKVNCFISASWNVKLKVGISLVIQWLRFCTSTSGGVGSIPGQGTKIPHTEWCGQKKKKKIISVVHSFTHLFAYVTNIYYTPYMCQALHYVIVTCSLQCQCNFLFLFLGGKQWVYVERNTFHRQIVGHLRRPK